MKIINEENDRAARDSQWSCRFCSGGLAGIAECREFAFSRAACGNTLEEGHRARLPVHHQFKLIALQAFDKVSFFVEYGDGCLDQFGVDADGLGFLLGIRYRADY